MESESSSKYNSYYYISLVCAVWFLVCSPLWTYAACFVFSFPFGLLSLLFWFIGKRKDDQKERYKKIKVMLLMALVIACISILCFTL